jgi:RNA polymerase sigma factor (sigma-70 family)
MNLPERDLHSIPSAEFPRLGEAELIRIFSSERAASDEQGRERARAAWHALVAGEVERVRQLVAAFRFPDVAGVRVELEERDDAVQAALERCLEALSRSFRGTSVGEFRAALATCVRYACMDFCRRRLRRERGIAGSLDEELPGGEGEPLHRFDREFGELAARLEEGRFGVGLELDALAGAIAALPNENMRAVLRLTLEGRESREIGERLQLQQANVDQLRSRGIRRLREALAEHER